MWIQMQKRPLTKIKAKKAVASVIDLFLLILIIEFENKIANKERKL